MYEENESVVLLVEEIVQRYKLSARISSYMLPSAQAFAWLAGLASWPRLAKYYIN